MTFRLPILLAIVATTQAFSIPSRQLIQTSLRLGKGILEMAEVDAATVFPPPPIADAFLGNYEDLEMPGKEGHGYQLIFEDEESFRLYIKQRTPSPNQEVARQRAREHIGYSLKKDLVGNVPETKPSIVPHLHDQIDFFSSHAVGTMIPDHVTPEHARQRARDNIDFFLTMVPNDTKTTKDMTTHARLRARNNIDFFALQDKHAFQSKQDSPRDNIDFFSNHATTTVLPDSVQDDHARATARLNIGFFS
ncbi:hypothetical protein FisN_19Lh239 [Fistulifera solaris]|uniref:Uncharacterized protein n=1 Tax=Fistulifera solaris TaxID=1519565 RepID=A0A1Z5K7H2_FISSO|nr:hypothetical protein FisN_19Lh239 [Fistulifera solaris]|eukprot:GAX22179.1 hypothetical protein FisN_19Lh239 [Fistulifera solaris]